MTWSAMAPSGKDRPDRAPIADIQTPTTAVAPARLRLIRTKTTATELSKKRPRLVRADIVSFLVLVLSPASAEPLSDLDNV